MSKSKNTDSVCAKIYCTSDYGRFTISKENRDVDLKKSTSKKLKASMKKYGWLVGFPMVCREDNGGNLIIIDGQHRYSIAKEIGKRLVYVIDNTEVDIAEINEAQAGWRPVDYMNRWQKAGKKDYNEIEDMKKTHPYVPFGSCVALLSGDYHYSHTKDSFEGGTFKVKTKGIAYRIANTYKKIIDANNDARSTNMIKALYACFLVDDFDAARLVDKCQKFPHMIQSYSKREDYLEMCEEIYNHAVKSGRIPLKFAALEALKKRNESIES